MNYTDYGYAKIPAKLAVEFCESDNLTVYYDVLNPEDNSLILKSWMNYCQGFSPFSSDSAELFIISLLYLLFIIMLYMLKSAVEKQQNKWVFMRRKI